MWDYNFCVSDFWCSLVFSCFGGKNIVATKSPNHKISQKENNNLNHRLILLISQFLDQWMNSED